jgi:hypothetical protein
MKIEIARPPIYEFIAQHFSIEGQKGIYFCWGDKIFNPDDVKIPPAIMEHEKVHSIRQGDTIEGWWLRYCVDKEFRFAEELLAHRAEFNWYCQQTNANEQMPGYRSRKEYHLTKIAQRLSSPLYGSMISTSAARRAICNPS